MPLKVAILGGVGPGSGLATALMTALSEQYKVVGLTRSLETIHALESRMTERTNVTLAQADLLDAAAISTLIERIEAEVGQIAVYIHLAGSITLKSFLDTTDAEMASSIEVNCLSATAISRVVLQKMLPRNQGTLIFSGATASLRGGPRGAAFAAGKFALRGFAQALAREFGPQGIHVAHMVIDGMIAGPRAEDRFHAAPEQCIAPADLARCYLDLIEQPRSAWSQELDVRPWNEKF